MAKNELTLEELAKQIYQGAGGMGNVESIVHCMTRVRMKVINDDLVNVSELKAIPGVLGVVEDAHGGGLGGAEGGGVPRNVFLVFQIFLNKAKGFGGGQGF